MISFLYNLKGQATILNGLILLLILAYLLNRYQKRKAARLFLGISVLLFILCSTAYLPKYLANKMERKYPPYYLPVATTDTGTAYILALGSGYSLDKRLPPNGQLGFCALGRLAEAIRIHRLIKNSLIICSGYSSLGLEPQAQVTKRAAIVLGVDAGGIETLNNPSTTQEEARELGRLYDKSLKLIIVTDALHMDRAIRLFTRQGFHPIAAPTNYKVLEGPGQNDMQWCPSFENIGLIDYVIHEWLGGWKASISH